MHDVTQWALDLYESIVNEGTPILSINISPLIKHLGGNLKKMKRAPILWSLPKNPYPFEILIRKQTKRSRIYYKIVELQANRLEQGSMVLLTDERWFFTESTGNNFFMVQNGEILIPKPNDILRRISSDTCI